MSGTNNMRGRQGGFSSQTAADNAVRAKERYPQERMEKFMAEIEKCSNDVRCTWDPFLELYKEQDKCQLNRAFYLTYLRERGFDASIIQGSDNTRCSPYLVVKNTWNPPKP